jgi:hypothetical protein
MEPLNWNFDRLTAGAGTFEGPGMIRILGALDERGAANCGLFDHPVGASKQCKWEGGAGGFSGLEVDVELNFGY